MSFNKLIANKKMIIDCYQEGGLEKLSRRLDSDVIITSDNFSSKAIDLLNKQELEELEEFINQNKND